MTSTENWVTVAVLTWLPEAQVLKGLLESQGIETFIPEEYISTINPMVTGMQVRVQVRTSSVEEAKELLRESGPAEKTEKCPQCGGEDFCLTPIGLRGWFQFALCALMMVPMKGPRKRVCVKCDNRSSG